MIKQRREVLKTGGGLGVLGLLAAAGVIKPELAMAAWNENAFKAGGLEKTLAALGAGKPANSADISINAPDIAENGAVVPIGVSTTLSKVESISILIEKNPDALAASFKLPEGTEANVQTRCKMGQTSNVYALVKVDGKFLMAMKEVKVTLGGCGG